MAKINKKLTLAMILLMISLASFVAAAPLDFLNKIKLGSNAVTIAINTASILAGLFLIYNLIKKGLDEKYGKAVQPILALLSFIVALELNKNYSGTLLWKIPYFSNLFHLPVIVNTLIIGAGIYLVSQILLEEYIKDAPGLKWVIRIVVVIMALNFAMEPFEGGQTWDAIKADYKYVWQQPLLTKTKFYLFGAKDCVYDGQSGCYQDSDIEQVLGKKIAGATDDIRWGILTGSRLLIFALLFFVGVLALNTFLKTDLIGKKFIYALAFLLSSNMVNTGTSIGTSVLIGQLALSIVMYKAMKEKGGDKPIIRIISIISSVLLVEFVTKTIFGDKAQTLLTPMIGPLFSDVVWVFKDGFQIWDIFLLIGILLKTLFLNPISLVVIVIIIAVLGGAKAVKGLGDTGRYLKANIAKRLKGRIMLILSKLGINWARNWIRGIKPDSWPYVMLDNRALLQVNQQYNKRCEIYYAYWGIVTGQNPLVNEIYDTPIQYENYESLKDEFVLYRSSDSIPGSGAANKGWNRLNEDFINLVNETLRWLKVIEVRRGLNTPEQNRILSGLVLSKFQDIDKKRKRIEGALNTAYTEWHSRFVKLPGKEVSAYGLHNVLHLLAVFAYDIANICGASNKTFKIVPKTTRFTNGVQNEVIDNIRDDDGNKIPLYDDGIMVDQDYNISVAKNWRVCHNNILNQSSYNDELRLPIIRDISNYRDAISDMNSDWREFVNDMRDGRFHKASRLALTYVESIKQGIKHDHLIPKVNDPLPSSVNSAFDLRLMINPARFSFAGRPRLDSPIGDIGLKFVNGNKTWANQDVSVSTKGFGDVLNELITRDNKEGDEINEFLSTVVADLGDQDSKKTFRTLMEKEKKAEGS